MADQGASSTTSTALSRNAEHSAFVQLLSLEKTGETDSNDRSGRQPKETYFRARRIPFTPSYYPAAFGGHVYAQSGWAASLTVRDGFVLHVSWRCHIVRLETFEGSSEINADQSDAKFRTSQANSSVLAAVMSLTRTKFVMFVMARLTVSVQLKHS